MGQVPWHTSRGRLIEVQPHRFALRELLTCEAVRETSLKFPFTLDIKLDPNRNDLAKNLDRAAHYFVKVEFVTESGRRKEVVDVQDHGNGQFPGLLRGEILEPVLTLAVSLRYLRLLASSVPDIR